MRPSKPSPAGLHCEYELATAHSGCPWMKGIAITQCGMQGTYCAQDRRNIAIRPESSDNEVLTPRLEGAGIEQAHTGSGFQRQASPCATKRETCLGTCYIYV